MAVNGDQWTAIPDTYLHIQRGVRNYSVHLTTLDQPVSVSAGVGIQRIKGAGVRIGVR